MFAHYRHKAQQFQQEGFFSVSCEDDADLFGLLSVDGCFLGNAGLLWPFPFTPFGHLEMLTLSKNYSHPRVRTSPARENFHSPQTSPRSSWNCSFLRPLLSGFWFQRTSLLALSPSMVCLSRAFIYPPPHHSSRRDSSPPYSFRFTA